MPVWLCAKLPRGIYVGVAVTVTNYDENKQLVGSSTTFLDDRKACFETVAPLSSEGYTLIEMIGDTTYMDFMRPVPVTVELNLNGSLTRTILEYKWLILTHILLSALLRAILSNALFSESSHFKQLSENQRKITLAILLLKHFDKARVERVIIVSCIFATAEIGVMIWNLILPKRPLFMALL